MTLGIFHLTTENLHNSRAKRAKIANLVKSFFSFFIFLYAIKKFQSTFQKTLWEFHADVSCGEKGYEISVSKKNNVVKLSQRK